MDHVLPEIRIDVWSDYVCPFCYLEMPELERLRREHAGRIAIDWHAFELRPEPVPTLDPDGEYLHSIWSRSVYPMARERGLVLKLPPVQPRSRKAFEAVEHARQSGRFDDLHEALFRAFFQDGQDLGDIGVLETVAASVGFDRDALRGDIEAGRHMAKVLDDQRFAGELGITGVPAMLIRRADGSGCALMVAGAQPYQALAAAVERLLSL